MQEEQVLRFETEGRKELILQFKAIRQEKFPLTQGKVSFSVLSGL